MITHDTASAIRTMHSEGVPVKEIAAKLGVSQPTVRAYITDKDRGAKRGFVSRPNRKKLLDLADQDKLFEAYKTASCNSELLTKKINAEPAYFGLAPNTKIAPRTVRQYMLLHGPKTTCEPLQPQASESDVGRQLQIGFTKGKFKFVNESEERELYIFSAVYPWSHQTYFKILPDLTKASWLRGICSCMLQYGAPKEILCDYEKSLITSSSDADGVDFSKEFEWLCDQLKINPIASQPAIPQTKGMLDRSGRYLNKSGFGWVRLFCPNVKDVEELDEALQKWNETVASVDRSFDAQLDDKKIEDCQVSELYKIERQYLSIIDPKLGQAVLDKLMTKSE